MRKSSRYFLFFLSAATIPREGEMDEDEDEDAMQQSSATEEV